MNALIQIERNPKPFEGQEKAITILERNLLVSAGAGSGKTWVLTERYLEIISKGYSPSQIVAITFTEKAAGEMRERIRSAVQRMASQSIEPDTKAFWQEREQELKLSTITTIHGFCAKMLRSHPVEAGLDPEFAVLDGMEAGMLIRDVFQTAVEAFLEEDTEESVLLYEEFGLLQLITQTALDLYERIRTFHKSIEELWEETIQQIDSQRQLFAQRLQSVNQLIGQLRDEFSFIKSTTKKPPKYFAAFEDWMARYDQVYPKLIDSQGSLEESLIPLLQDLLENRWTKSGSDTLKALTDRLREESLPSLWECMILPQYPSLIQALLKLVARAGERYEKEKNQRQSVDFHDLETLTARLLSNHPEVCYKWQKKVHYLMVDEFQDTNALQKSIVDCLSGQGTQMKIFVVGDGKQSIYRFRGADVQIFYEIEKEIVNGGGEKVALSKNFRTQAGIIGYINSLFAELMQKNDTDPPYYTFYEELDAHRQLPKEEPQIELICTTEKEDDEFEKDTEENGEDLHWVEIEADALSRRIKQMVVEQQTLAWKKDDSGKEVPSPVRYGDICVLLAARSQMHHYEFAFQEYGIPYIVVGGRQFYGKQEVLDVINVLRMVHDPSDETSLLGFLRSPFVQLSDSSLFWLTRGRTLTSSFYSLEEKPLSMDEGQWEKLLLARRWVQEWVQISKWDTIHSLLRRILQDSGYDLMLIGGSMGEQKLANVEKLMKLSSELVDQKGYHLYDFLQFLKRMQEDAVQEEEASVIENAADAVVIMSVHASKGLEFPVVCIPELRKDVLKKGGIAPPVLYQPGAGVALRLKDIEKGMPGNGIYERFLGEEKDREIQEAKRLLYVAMTRARDHLILIGSKSRGRNTWLQWITQHLGGSAIEELISQQLIENADWKLKVTTVQDLPLFPKVSERTETAWALWLQNMDSLSDNELPSLPLMDNLYAEKNLIRLPVLSASALMEYRRCPQSFYLRYMEGIRGLDALFFTDVVEGKNSYLSATEIGTVVHSLIEKTDWDHSVVPDWSTLLEPTLEQLGIPTYQISEQNRSVLQRFAQSFRNFAEVRRVGRFESEKQLLMLWDQHRISGTIDLLQHHPDGTVQIFDFKTNRVSKPLKEIVEPYLWQGYLYVFMVEAVLHKTVSSMQFVFLDSSEIFSLDLSSAAYTAAKERFNFLIREIQDACLQQHFSCCQEPSCVCSVIGPSLSFE